MEIDLAICHLERPNKWFGLGARLAGARVISVVHNIGLYEAKSLWKKILLRSFYRWIPSRIVAVSEGVAEYLCEFGLPAHRIDVIPNGVDVQALRGRGDSVSEHGLVLCVLARLEPVKGLDLLLRALSQLTDHPWSLKIIGDGSSRPDLEQLASRLGISTRVSFLGLQHDPFNFLHDVGAICMPSRREGLPMALLECQAIGLPAIVSDVGYLSKIVTDGYNGFICRSGSLDSLVDALERFFAADQSSRHNLVVNSRTVANGYDIKECVAQYMALAEMTCEKK
jgi:glycosyltransferase involved in cell wall biosynthesis